MKEIKERKKEEKVWHLPALAKQRDRKKMSPPASTPGKYPSSIPAPQINASKLGEESLSHKIWVLFKELLLDWALG